MKSIRAYRVGSTYRSVRWLPEAEEVALVLAGGVWVSENPQRELLVYTSEHTVGVGLNTAIALGLCFLTEAASGPRLHAQRELRAVSSERISQELVRLMAAIVRAAGARDPVAKGVLRASPEETLCALAEHFEIAADQEP